VTKEELIGFAEGLVNEGIDMLALKNRDYAAGDDAFHNFHTVAQYLGLTREQVLATYLYKHLSAIFAYTRGEYADSEPIEGRIKDAMNYLLFLAAMASERKPATSIAEAVWDGGYPMPVPKVDAMPIYPATEVPG
jgi:hypothetical protein